MKSQYLFLKNASKFVQDLKQKEEELNKSGKESTEVIVYQSNHVHDKTHIDSVFDLKDEIEVMDLRERNR